MIGVPGIESSRLVISSILRRSFSISGAEPPPDADVDARPRLARVDAVHERAFAIGHHLERQLVVVAQEDRPLTVRRNLRRLAHDVVERIAVLFGDRHEHARHQREVERHLAFVAVAEVRADVFGPLVRLGEQQPVGKLRIEDRAQALEHGVRLGQVLVGRAFALAQIRHGVEPHAVDAHREPEAHHVGDRVEHRRMIEVQVGLVAEEAVPVVLAGDRIPGPVRRLGVGEDDARAGVASPAYRSTRRTCGRTNRAARGARAGTTDADRRCG